MNNQKYTLYAHFDFPPCLHYSCVSDKTYVSCGCIWYEVPNWVTELEQLQIIEPEILSEDDEEILKWWAQ